MSMSVAKTALAVCLALFSGGLTPQPNESTEAENLKKMIAHFRQMEESRKRVLEEMAKLNVTLTTSPPHPPVLMKNDDIRRAFLEQELLIETQREDPDYAKATRIAEAKAVAYIRNRQDDTRDYRDQVKRDIEKFRTTREKLEARLKAQQENTSLVGPWKGRVETPFSWYEYRWDITSSGLTAWKVEQTLVDTNHGFHRQSIGKKYHTYTMSKTSTGYYLHAEEKDENPGNPGAFVQTGTLTLRGGTLSGTGEHKGTNLTHWIKFTATRIKE
jgi:hypothetical protein